MELRNLKEFLKKHDIYLYDEQYRILNAILKRKPQRGGGKCIYKEVLGNSKCLIEYNIKNIFKM